MSEPDWEDQRNRVITISYKVQKLLELDWLKVEHQFTDNGGDGLWMAETASQWEYRYAEITWSLPAVIQARDSAIESVAIHEFVHILLGPIDQFVPKNENGRKLNEFAVESVTRAIMAAKGAL